MPRTSRPSRVRSAHYHLAVLPLINTVIFPRAVIPLYVNREQSLRAVEAAATNDTNLLAVAQQCGRTGAELVAYWQGEGLVGTRPNIADAPAHARTLRERAQR